MGNSGPSTAQPTGLSPVLHGHQLVGEDPVGLPGEQGRAGAAAAVQVHAGLFADLVPLAVGQDPQLRLVLLAGDVDGAVGDDRVAEPIGSGDAQDVLAPLGVVDPEGHRPLPRLGIGLDLLLLRLALGDAARLVQQLDDRGRECLTGRLAAGIGRS